MVEEESFETEKYHFHFYPDEHFARTNMLMVDVTTVEGRNVTNDDMKELELFFNDMGRWENLSNAARDVLEDSGIISEKRLEKPVKELGSEKYVIKTERDNQFVRIRIHLAPEERRRRTQRAKQSEEFSLKEIVEQVKNIPKWQRLKKTLVILREQI